MSRHDTDIRRRVARNIARAIEEQDLTVAEVARRIGGHERAVRRWRNGDGAPNVESLAHLALALDRDINWFYADHEQAAEVSA